MATLKLPAVGYGIRYDFGIFNQRIVNGSQVEMPEMWLQFRNPWEIEHPIKQTIKYYGKTIYVKDHDGKTRFRWVDTSDVIAIPYDIRFPAMASTTSIRCIYHPPAAKSSIYRISIRRLHWCLRN